MQKGDNMSQAKGYVDTDYLRTTAGLLDDFKQRTYRLMRIEPGQRLLDVGCGPGTDTIPLARLVGVNGHVTGVDYDAAMIAEADRRAALAGVGAWVRHLQHSAETLPFATDTFDGCRSERLFQHLAHPEQALREMVRLTRPGGWVVVADADWGTLSIDSREVETEPRLARAVAERSLHNGYAGRQLYGMVKRQGLEAISLESSLLCLTDYATARQVIGLDEVALEALAAGLVTEIAIDRWRADLEQAARQGVFFASIGGIIVAGRKAAPSGHPASHPDD